MDEKSEIMTEARRLGLAGAHLVGAIVMAHLHGDHVLPDSRTAVDDLIDELAALREQVARIGRNVNRITYRLNSGGQTHSGDPDVLTQAGQVLVLAWQAADAIETAAIAAVRKHRAA